MLLQKNIEEYSKELQHTLEGVSPRSREIVCRRYGVFCDTKDPLTFEKIGDSFSKKITRERVRQILNETKKKMATKDETYTQNIAHILNEITTIIDKQYGGIFSFEGLEHEDIRAYKNILILLLDCAKNIQKIKETQIVREHYCTVTKNIETRDLMIGLRKFCQKVRNMQGSVFTRKELHSILKKEIKTASGTSVSDNAVSTLLDLCKEIHKNKYDDYAHKSNPVVRLKNIGDYIQLILRREDRPMHYADLAKKISQMKGRGISKMFCLNSMVRDKDMFVRVGSGIYTLVGKGHKGGTVADVIRSIFLEHKKKLFHKKEICDMVLEERDVKKQTVIKYLKSSPWFEEIKKDRWTLSAWGKKDFA